MWWTTQARRWSPSPSRNSRARRGGSRRTSNPADSSSDVCASTSAAPVSTGVRSGNASATSSTRWYGPDGESGNTVRSERCRPSTSAIAERRASTSNPPRTRTVKGMLWRAGCTTVRSMKYCDGDSGTRSGSGAAPNFGPRGRPAFCGCAPVSAIVRASAATVGASKSSRTPRVVPSSALIVATTRMADSESPLRSKKESSAPTEATPSTWANTRATRRSAGVSGSR